MAARPGTRQFLIGRTGGMVITFWLLIICAVLLLLRGFQRHASIKPAKPLH